MADHWAVVIGVDEYWRPEACLSAGVRDALAMHKWLTHPTGGQVPPRNVALLLSPRQASTVPVNCPPATCDSIFMEIDRLLQRSGGDGNRLFFHFSGHGLTSRIDFSDESGIVPTDFRDNLPTKAITLRSLFELFQSTNFVEQFFFIDACRNIPYDTEKRLGEYPNPEKTADRPGDQFGMYATMKGKKAIEVRRPGDESGAFTQALLEGLTGKGSAKSWDGQAQEYVVRWASLFEYVERAVKARKLPAGANAGDIQEPRQHGERSSRNPELARFPENAFPDETLAVDLDPPSIGSQASVIVRDMVHDRERRPAQPLPVTFPLPPRVYSVSAAAPGYVSVPRRVELNLYEHTHLRFELHPQPPGPTPPSPPAPSGGGLRQPIPGAPGGAGSHAHAEVSFAQRGLGDQESAKPGELRVECRDLLAYLQVTNESGRVVGTGRSPLYLEDLSAGFYRARLLGPEVEVAAKTIELRAGADESISLGGAQAADPLLRSISAAAGFYVDPESNIHVSEAVGASATLRLSTVLALAAAATLEAGSQFGQRLKSLQLPPWPRDDVERNGGVQLVFGASDAATRGEPAWESVSVRCWPMDAKRPEVSEHPLAHPKFPTIATSSLPRVSGTHWLSLTFASQATLTLPVAILAGRVALIVLTSDASGRSDVQQYSVGLSPSHSHLTRDPVFPDAEFPAIRRIELMQRYVASGQVTPIKPDIDMLLCDKWVDSIAGCLGGYLLLRERRAEDLRVPAQNLVRHFGELSDAHVLLGAFYEHIGDDRFVSAYERALDIGVPLFRHGLAHLHARREVFSHARQTLVEELLRLVPAGSLWSGVPAAIETMKNYEPPSQTGYAAL